MEERATTDPTAADFENQATNEGAVGANDWADVLPQAHLATAAPAALEAPLSHLFELTKANKTSGRELRDWGNLTYFIADFAEQVIPKIVTRLGEEWNHLGEAAEERDGEKGRQALTKLHNRLIDLGQVLDQEADIVDWLDRLSLLLANIAVGVADTRTGVSSAIEAGWGESSAQVLPKVGWARARIAEG